VEKWAESGVQGSRRSRRTGEWVNGDVQTGRTSVGGQGGSGIGGESLARLESAVEREEEREGNSGRGRGDRQISDGEVCCGGSFGGRCFSGRGGRTSDELQSGHAPGNDGVGEGAIIVKENKKGVAMGHLRESAFGEKCERDMVVLFNNPVGETTSYL
jgi:hypothetical protein